jgi:hypothetical protein
MPKNLKEFQQQKPRLLFDTVDRLPIPEGLKKTMAIFISGVTGQTPAAETIKLQKKPLEKLQ